MIPIIGRKAQAAPVVLGIPGQDRIAAILGESISPFMEFLAADAAAGVWPPHTLGLGASLSLIGGGGATYGIESIWPDSQAIQVNGGSWFEAPLASDYDIGAEDLLLEVIWKNASWNGFGLLEKINVANGYSVVCGDTNWEYSGFGFVNGQQVWNFPGGGGTDFMHWLTAMSGAMESPWVRSYYYVRMTNEVTPLSMKILTWHYGAPSRAVILAAIDSLTNAGKLKVNGGWPYYANLESQYIAAIRGWKLADWAAGKTDEQLNADISKWIVKRQPKAFVPYAHVESATDAEIDQITLNSITKAPDLAYEGQDATLAQWPARNGYGPTLGITGVGPTPAIGTATPFFGRLGVKINGNGSDAAPSGQFYLSPDTTSGNVGLKDFIIRAIIKKSYKGNADWEQVFGKRYTESLANNVAKGWFFANIGDSWTPSSDNRQYWVCGWNNNTYGDDITIDPGGIQWQYAGAGSQGYCVLLDPSEAIYEDWVVVSDRSSDTLYYRNAELVCIKSSTFSNGNDWGIVDINNTAAFSIGGIDPAQPSGGGTGRAEVEIVGFWLWSHQDWINDTNELAPLIRQLHQSTFGKSW
jgi:hypothetical protein